MLTSIIKSILVSCLVFMGIIFYNSQACSEEIPVPKDELARDSVLPVFDNRVAVKNRNVKDTQTFDVGVFGGLAITEPVYNATKLGLALNYHFNETHSLGFLWVQNTVGLSKDAQGIKEDFTLDFTRAPYPQYSMMADYNYKVYYGKLSFTKNGVINTSIYTSAAAGIIKFVHKSYPGIAFGVGERFYLTNNIALKIDLRILANQAPIPFKKGSLLPTDPIPSYDSFSERMAVTTHLEFGLNYLF